MNALQQRAYELYDESGITPEALNRMEREIHADQTLLALAVRQAAYDSLHAAQCLHRRGVAGGPSPRIYPQEVRDRVQAAAGRWHSWPLMDGTPLGDATRVQVLRDASRFRLNEVGNGRNRRFLESVAARLRDPNCPVRDVLDEGQLERLMQQAERGAREAVVPE